MGMRTEDMQIRLHYAAIAGRQATPETIHRFEAVVRFGAYSPNPVDKHIPYECPLCVATARNRPKPRTAAPPTAPVSRPPADEGLT
jgi:hypothetical protein